MNHNELQNWKGQRDDGTEENHAAEVVEPPRVVVHEIERVFEPPPKVGIHYIYFISNNSSKQ